MALYRIGAHLDPNSIKGRIPLAEWIPESTPVPDLAAACQGLLASTQSLIRSKTEDILDLFQAFSDQLLAEHGELLSSLSPAGLPFIVSFLRKSNLSRMLETSLPGRSQGLDGFIPLAGQTTQVRARPRGMVVHWLAGNVLSLGIISLIQGLLTRNANLVKLPSASGHILPPVFSLIREVEIKSAEGRSLHGEELLNCVMFVACESSDREAQSQLSQAADVRVIWGGEEAVEQVTKLPRRPYSEDLIFGPKHSLVVLGKDALTRDNLAQVAEQVARDASWFEQEACTSPHSVYVETGGEVTPQEFAQGLAAGMEKVLKRIPLLPLSPAQAYAVVEARSLHQLTGEVFSSSGTEWTVILPGPESETPRVGARVVYVRPLHQLTDLQPVISRSTQTLGLLMHNERRTSFAEMISAMGIDRITPPGEMHLYDHPWDGMFPLDRLVRWVSLR
jgi:hypothetical protein